MPKAKQKLKKGTQEEFIERVKSYMDSEEKNLARAGLRKTLIVSFVKRKNVPFWSRLALKVVKSQGGMLDTRYLDSTGTNL